MTMAENSRTQTETNSLSHTHTHNIDLNSRHSTPEEESSQANASDAIILKPEPVQQLSKRAQKRLLKKEQLKALRKAKRATRFTKNSNPGFDKEIFSATDYYFENGLRKVYPYPYTFSTYAKERWFGLTLQEVFQNEFRVDTPDNIRSSIRKGNLRVNGHIVDSDYTLKNGDLIEHCIHRHENPVSGKAVEIIEDTPDVVVINKPSSIPCHPCGKFRFNSIVFIMGKEFGYSNLRNIYRLDRLTSGVLILGKTARKTKELETQVLKRQVHKEYVARVIGQFPDGEVEVNQPLDCLSHKLTLWQVRKGGKPSRTTFHRLSYNGKTSLVRCIPHTGRTHQIRVHLQYLGHPIVNDPYYNSTAWGPLRGKGGKCDATLEEICRRIMQEHNVGMWLEGENPLFGERLDNAESCLGLTLGGETDSQLAEPRALESPPSSPELKKRRSSSESRSCQDPAAQAVDGGGDGDGSTGFDVVFQAGTSDGCEEGSLTDSPMTKSILPAAGLPGLTCVTHSGAEVPLSEETNGGSDTAALDGMERQKVNPREFDPDKWVPDPDCQSCRLKYVDPRPTDLLLYLHAYKYKGPTWEYTARMPDWVAEDWEEPPEYSHFLQ